MEYTLLTQRFKFEPKGVSKNAMFTGPVILRQEGLFLGIKSAMTQSATSISALFGLIGMLIAMAMSKPDKIALPYPDVRPNELPDELRLINEFSKLKDKHKVVIIAKDQIKGYSTSMLKGFTVHCDGESITLFGSAKKMKAAFEEVGITEYDMNAEVVS